MRGVKAARKAAGRAIKALAKPFRACLRPPRVEEGQVADAVDVIDVRRDAVIATDVVMPPKVTEEVTEPMPERELASALAAAADALFAQHIQHVQQIQVTNAGIQDTNAENGNDVEKPMDEKAQLALYQELKEIDAAVDEVGKVIHELIQVVVEEVLDDWDREGVIDMDWEPNMDLVEKIYDIYQPETYSEPTAGAESVGAESVGAESVEASFLESNQEPTKIEKAPLILSEEDEQPDTPTTVDQVSPGKSVALSRFAPANAANAANAASSAINTINTIDTIDTIRTITATAASIAANTALATTTGTKPLLKSCLKKTSSFGPEAVIDPSRPKKSVRFDTRDNVQEGAMNVSIVYYCPTSDDDEAAYPWTRECDSDVDDDEACTDSGSDNEYDYDCDDYPRKLDPSKHIDDALSDDEMTVADDARDIETLSDDELLDWNRDIRHWIQFFLAYRPPIAGIFRSALGGETH